MFVNNLIEFSFFLVKRHIYKTQRITVLTVGNMSCSCFGASFVHRKRDDAHASQDLEGKDTIASCCSGWVHLIYHKKSYSFQPHTVLLHILVHCTIANCFMNIFNIFTVGKLYMATNEPQVVYIRSKLSTTLIGITHNMSLKWVVPFLLVVYDYLYLYSY